METEIPRHYLDRSEIDVEYRNVDIMKKGKVVNLGCKHWSVRSSGRRGRCKGGELGRTLFYPAISFSLLEYMIIWRKIQVIIDPYDQTR